MVGFVGIAIGVDDFNGWKLIPFVSSHEEAIEMGDSVVPGIPST